MSAYYSRWHYGRNGRNEPSANTVGNKNAGIPATEDLMREHGAALRIELIYNEAIMRLRGFKQCDHYTVNSVVFSTATISQRFIDNYHQRLEEDYIFTVFQEKKQYLDLVHTLKKQHDAARQLTQMILRQSAAQPVYMQGQIQLANLMAIYIQMYQPHTSREDTILFPAFRSIVPPGELESMGKRFEEIEERKFGRDGFKTIVAQIEQIEMVLGINELNQYTPNFYF